MAGRRSSSYTVVASPRQPSAARLPHAPYMAAALARVGRMVTVAGLAAGLSGCAGIMMPLSSWMSGSTPPPAEETTGTTGRAATAAPATPDTDGEAVRRAIEVAVARGGEAPVAWKNDATGHSGTLTHLAAVRASNGAPCRDFETTLVTVQGVDLHGGRACQGYWGSWEMLKFDRIGG